MSIIVCILLVAQISLFITHRGLLEQVNSVILLTFIFLVQPFLLKRDDGFVFGSCLGLVDSIFIERITHYLFISFLVIIVFIFCFFFGAVRLCKTFLIKLRFTLNVIFLFFIPFFIQLRAILGLINFIVIIMETILR
jgi:hypothetical protein